MNNNSDSKATQGFSRANLLKSFSADSVSNILHLIEEGEEPRRIFLSIVECAASTPGAQSSAIFLPSEKSNNQPEILASFGNFATETSKEGESDKSSRHASQAIGSTFTKTRSGSYYYFDIVCLGASIGTLCVIAPNGLTPEGCDKLALLAHHTGVVYERQKLSHTLQLFLDRLEVLNELNQLIASNVGLQRIVKSIARESAFRFSADVALAFLLNEETNCLEVKGGYGCTPNIIPKQIDLRSGILGQVMKVGGHISIANLKNHSGHELNFLDGLDIRSIDVCCLEVRGEPLGALVIGFRRELQFSQSDLTRFEEFCQGGAVAIATARNQERISSYTERLEELVESRTADLAIQTAKAEEANHAKSQFLANMSHELRTPLTAIVGYASVLVDGIFGGVNDKQRDALNAIARSSEHLKQLIDDVLNLARIESGKEDPDLTRVCLKDLVPQVYKLMQQTALGKSVTLLPLEIPKETMECFITTDTKHIHQILINLLSNAIKYTPKGGKVWITAESMVDKIKIAVSDTGVGIPPHKLEKLFERFERGEDTYSKSQEGTGIGLNLTRRLVELNGGRIGVESREGKGSTFWILIPSAEKESSVVTQVEPQELRAKLDGLSTLVVDDNKDTCEVLRHILMAAGAAVRTVNSVRDGIAAIAESRPDIILTDLAIPGESGLVLIEHVRGSGNSIGKIPIMVLSACAFESDKEAALSAGASLFIPKPFKPAEIVRSVRELAFGVAMRGRQKDVKHN